MNNFEKRQGEIVMGVDTKPFSNNLKLPKKNFMVADVRFANGADDEFVKSFFAKFPEGAIDFEKFYGYSAWNTSANTLGSLICASVVRFFAASYNEVAFKELQLVRFLDDWAYQSKIRQALKKLSKEPNSFHVKTLMLAFENQLKEHFKTDFKVEYGFPWSRFFEIEVCVAENSKAIKCAPFQLKQADGQAREKVSNSTFLRAVQKQETELTELSGSEFKIDYVERPEEKPSEEAKEETKEEEIDAALGMLFEEDRPGSSDWPEY